MAGILLFVIIKLYPFPNFLPDSYSYIDAAYNNVNINMWPVGYSKFLRLISVFNRSDTGLVIVQYVLLQLAILFFFILYKILVAAWQMDNESVICLSCLKSTLAVHC